MKNLLLKHKKIFGFISIFSLICLVYLYYKTQSNPSQIVPIFAPTPTLSNQIRSPQPAINQIKKYQVEFLSSFYSTTIPTTLNLYSASFVEENLNEIAQNFIINLNLRQHPTIPNFWTSDNQLISLLLNYKAQTLHLNKTSSQTLYNQKYTLSQAINAVKSLTNQYFFLANFEILENKIEYFQIPEKGHHLESVSDSQIANLYYIPMSYKIDGYPSYHKGLPNPQVQISIAPGNFLSKLIYISQPKLNTTNPRPFNTLSVDEIKKSLESGNGEIISINLMDLPYKANEIPLISLTRVEIEYRYNDLTRESIPYFRLTGYYPSEFNPDPKNNQSPIEIILPAVKI